jgi:hypothetical protein
LGGGRLKGVRALFGFFVHLLGDGPLGSTLVSLYLDGDNVADMTIQVVHQPA